jgi:hypothetical protein
MQLQDKQGLPYNVDSKVSPNVKRGIRRKVIALSKGYIDNEEERKLRTPRSSGVAMVVKRNRFLRRCCGGIKGPVSIMLIKRCCRRRTLMSKL